MTAFVIGYEVYCDGPTTQDDCPESAAVRASVASRTARQVRADGRAQGWTARHGGGRLIDLCPSCTAKRQDGARP
ncbi:hypothetical protein ACFUN7_24400 [Streptomyces sp. NPDC057236]|uniref:hypothetical protein n=1 Tax=Streptomyces sp. NPDC057236 TaxID=3346059 RepID=UPI00363C3570